MTAPAADERAAVLAYLVVSAERAERRAATADTGTQRRIASGQARLLRALIRDLAAGAHLADGVLR